MNVPKPHILVSLLATLAIAVTLAVAGQVGAQTGGGFSAESTGLSSAGKAGGYEVNQPCVEQPGGCIPNLVGRIVSALLGLFGALFLVLIIYGGVQYMLSQGDQAKVKAARETIINAVIGMVVVALSYAIAYYVINIVSGVAGGGVDVQQPS